MKKNIIIRLREWMLNETENSFNSMSRRKTRRWHQQQITAAKKITTMTAIEKEIESFSCWWWCCRKKNVYKKGKKEEFLSLRRFHMPPLTREWREFSDITRLFFTGSCSSKHFLHSLSHLIHLKTIRLTFSCIM